MRALLAPVYMSLFPYVCEVCGRRFNSEWAREAHEKKAHG